MDRQRRAERRVAAPPYCNLDHASLFRETRPILVSPMERWPWP
jgi:hypothetical protein